MSALYDSSALVALYVEAHPRHQIMVDTHLDLLNDVGEFYVCAHSLAELYSTITKGVSYMNFSPVMAETLIEEAIMPLFKIVELDKVDYLAVINFLKKHSLRGGIIYDALIARASANVEADSLVTFNVKDFKRVRALTTASILEP